MQSKIFKIIKKILIIRLSSIGDIVLTTELLRLVKSKYPDSQIHYLVSSKFISVLENNPNIDHIIPYDKSLSMKRILIQRDKMLFEDDFSSYDLIIDLQRNLRSVHYSNGIANKILKIKKWRISKLRMVKFKRLDKQIPRIPINYLNSINELDINSDGKGLEFWVDGEKQYNYSIKNYKDNPIIGVAPGAHHFSKRFPAEKYAKVVKILKEKLNPKEIRIFGSNDDSLAAFIIRSEIPEIIDFTGKLSLTETAKEIDKCGLFLTNDTGLMHIASARKIPLVAIFGSTVKNFGFEPYGTEYRIVENKDIECRPCSHIGKSSCPKKHFKCMLEIDIQEIVKNVLELARLQ